LARTVAGKDYVVLMADIFGLGYGDKPKTPQDLMAGMRAVHDDLAFTIGCGGKAYDTLHGAAGRGRDSLKLHDRWVGKQILRLARASDIDRGTRTWVKETTRTSGPLRANTANQSLRDRLPTLSST
jgi:hypothetical protein